jgi:hypothetical protein
MAENRVFTTWRAVYNAMLSDLMDNTWRRISNYTVNASGAGGSFSMAYKSLSEFMALLKMVEDKVAVEEGGYARRMYVRNGGRG